MPHCIIEYTANADIDIKNLIDVAFESVDQSGLFDRSAIKARAIRYEHYKSGQSRDDYIHITIKILSGRNAAQKKHLSDVVLEKVAPHIANIKSLTVDIVDMDRASYGKLLNND
ncbi:MAG: 5-carboxymethyl-2-hydroxymuconate Delta-isomerase [Kordiimonadaceae bacterium]|nr:5-carboxymethyl-2-hydroxymuconate Delta-isomerase [Kordiimonadaceae bacterium]MBT6035599.1 5-carboxymethyl-2-hydroxymuconate Delta-isomerase [Kordiimonadaceae bacterium]MBT6330732.1 5-carboxymethyl-2-hydroxymuconate Delta-isomerase [Kordiimonadaceae bacterium]MBT7582598.1 5-carboxymethyl-2-hydroxymuconate Delta-isomerase [Kordiimonadaceae bacterium]